MTGRRPVLRLLRPLLLAAWRPLVAALAWAALTLMAGTALFTVAGAFLTAASLAGVSIAFDVFAPSALVRGLSFLRIGSRYVERISGHKATLALMADLRAQLFARMAQLEPAQLAQYSQGELADRMVGDIDALEGWLLLVLTPLVAGAGAALVFAVVGGWLYPLFAALIVAVMALALAWVPARLGRAGQQAGHAVRTQAGRLRSLVHDAVTGHVDILAFAAGPGVYRQFEAGSQALRDASQRIVRASARGQSLQQLLLGAALLGILVVGLPAWQDGVLGAPMWVGMMLGVLALFEATGPLMRGASRLGASRAAAQRLEVMQQPTQRAARRRGASLPKQGVLQLERVSFAYVPHARVLHEVNLRVPQGECVALTGPSGSGKSTLLGLIPGLLHADHGTIHYGGVPLDQAGDAAIWRRFTLLTQDSPVFMGSVRDNLLMGRPGASDAELWDALNRVRLADAVSAMDGGLDAWVGESGRRLSLGQARRLCLARAVLTPASVWLLDEPTAGLDPTTQQALLRDLKSMAAGRTVVIATHAPLPQGAVDRVLRLVSGAVL